MKKISAGKRLSDKIKIAAAKLKDMRQELMVLKEKEKAQMPAKMQKPAKKTAKKKPAKKQKK